MAYTARLLRASVIPLTLIAGSLAAVVPIKDSPTQLPAGTTYNSETHLLCTPTTWTDIASFFLGNYLSHAATVVVFPGEPAYLVVLNMIIAILFPSMGLSRGILAIRRHAALYKDPIQKATRSRAMCMVVRSPSWVPKPDETIHQLTFVPKDLIWDDIENWKHKKETRDDFAALTQHKGPIEVRIETPPWVDQDPGSERIEIVGREYQVFGNYKLPPGFELAYVPPNAIVNPTTSSHPEAAADKPSYIVASSYSFASALIAIIQIIYASVTLYRSRGHQVDKYGYAAFGFTVLPYLIMSFVNLLGNLVTPRYSTIYLVHSEIMDEASQRGGHFDGIVGSLESAPLDWKNGIVFSGSVQGLPLEPLEEKAERTWKFQLDATSVSKEKLHSLQAGETLAPEKKNDPASSLAVAEETLQTKHNIQNPYESSKPEGNIKGDTGKDNGGKKKDKNEDKKPVIVCPSCYSFKVSEENFGWLQPSDNKKHRTRAVLITLAVRLVIGAMPLVVIGAMSHFKQGSSTAPERAWILSWLVLGMAIIGNPFFMNWIIRILIVLNDDRRQLDGSKSRSGGKIHLVSHLAECIGLFLVTGGLATPAFGGFVMVAQMLREYGSCSILG
ncbi:unnamed protein product [Penicillium glandicola]